MHVLGKCLREPVRERLEHDASIVVRALEVFFQRLFFADSSCDSETANVVGNAALFRCNEISKRGMGTVTRRITRNLLAQRMQNRQPRVAWLARI